MGLIAETTNEAETLVFNTSLYKDLVSNFRRIGQPLLPNLPYVHDIYDCDA